MKTQYICPHCRTKQELPFDPAERLSMTKGVRTIKLKRQMSDYKCKKCNKTNVQ